VITAQKKRSSAHVPRRSQVPLILSTSRDGARGEGMARGNIADRGWRCATWTSPPVIGIR
jgi:hypothetical protein